MSSSFLIAFLTSLIFFLNSSFLKVADSSIIASNFFSSSFPNLGLKQHLHYLSFVETENIDSIIGDFESDVRNQMQQDCNIEYELDKDNKHIKVCLDTCHINDAGYDLNSYSLLYEFTNVNNSIKVINYSFVD